MPDDADAHILKVFRRQLRQNVLVDLVLAEYRLIPLEAEAPQPTAEVHVSPQIPSLARQSSSTQNNLSRVMSNRASLACGGGTAVAETRKLAVLQQMWPDTASSLALTKRGRSRGCARFGASASENAHF